MGGIDSSYDSKDEARTYDSFNSIVNLVKLTFVFLSLVSRLCRAGSQETFDEESFQVWKKVGGRERTI